MPAVNQAVAQVTGGRNTRNSSRTADGPSSTVTSAEANLTPTIINSKSCSVVITKSENTVQGIQKAQRAKPLRGPDKNPTHKTLAQLKKPQVTDLMENEDVAVSVIEDCHISVRRKQLWGLADK